MSFYALRALAAAGVVRDLRTPPRRVLRGDAGAAGAAEALARAGAA